MLQQLYVHNMLFISLIYITYIPFSLFTVFPYIKEASFFLARDNFPRLDNTLVNRRELVAAVPPVRGIRINVFSAEWEEKKSAC